MSPGEGRISPRLADWCGWVLAGLFALTPLLAWLGPLGFAPLLALAGLLTLPAVRLRREDWPLAAVVVVLVAWAAISTLWSPFRPGELEEQTALKLALQAPLYWSVICAARVAGPRPRAAALRILAWGLAVLAIVMVVEALSGAALYRQLRSAAGDYDPARPDLAQRNVAQAAYILAILWAPASLAALRTSGPKWLPLAVIAALTGLAFTFGSDAPMLATALAVAAAVAVIRWPKGAPRALGVAAALFVLLAPWLVLAAEDAGLTQALQRALPLSWEQRIGYWVFAADRIGADPWRGWGLDASRMFAPGIHLHPHDAAVQVWLELGLAGALLAGGAWLLIFLRLGRERAGLSAAAKAAAAAAYFVVGAVSFGVWQEWWLALGALTAAACAAVQRQPAAIAQASMRRAQPAGVQARR